MMKEIVEGKWQYARFLFDLDGGANASINFCG